MRVLSLDSSTESASIAVIDENKLLGEITFNFEKQHSVVLMSMIDNLLSNLHMGIDSLDGFVVSRGPGSFTGLRIGMATIKGLCLGSSKPFVSVSSLDSLAYNLSFAPGIICPILDALRNNVYTCLYTFKNGSLEPVSDYMAVPIDELIELLKSKDMPVYVIGDAVDKFRDRFVESLNEVRFAPPHLNLARASSLGELGIKLLSSGVNEDLNTSTPIYLRKSQAEREYDKKMGIDSNE